MAIRTESGKRSLRIIVAVFMIILPAVVTGQGVIETETAAGVAQDSTGCPDKISLYKSARMNADPVAALGYWREALASCPAVSEDIYADGELMYSEMFDLTSAPEYIDSILMILTQRTYYFSNKPAHDMHKADLLLDLAGDDPEYLGLCYNILMEASESYPDQMDCGHFVQLATVAASLYAMGIIDAGEMSNAFVTTIGTVDDRIETGTGNCTNSDDNYNGNIQ